MGDGVRSMFAGGGRVGRGRRNEDGWVVEGSNVDMEVEIRLPWHPAHEISGPAKPNIITLNISEMAKKPLQCIISINSNDQSFLLLILYNLKESKKLHQSKN